MVTIDFYWKGNFDIFNTSSTDRVSNSDINNKFTINTYHSTANSYDVPIIVSKIVHESSQPANVITIYGRNFSPVLNENYVDCGAGWGVGCTITNVYSPATGVSYPNVGILGTKMRVTVTGAFPSGIPKAYNLTLGVSSYVPYRSQAVGPFMVYTSEMDLNDPGGVPNEDASPKILGIMQVSQPGGTEEVYKQTHRTDISSNDYRFLDPNIYFHPY